MKTKIAIASAALLAGCTTASLNQPTASSNSGGQRNAPTSPAVSHNTSQMSMDRYKRVLAQRIAEVNSDKIYPGNPQALLRSVVVLKYEIDSDGRLLHSDTLRSNGDTATVATALKALRKAAPFPPPPNNLLSHGRTEILETMLFNDDGRFQLRSIAAPQLNE